MNDLSDGDEEPVPDFDLAVNTMVAGGDHPLVRSSSVMKKSQGRGSQRVQWQCRFAVQSSCKRMTDSDVAAEIFHREAAAELVARRQREQAKAKREAWQRRLDSWDAEAKAKARADAAAAAAEAKGKGKGTVKGKGGKGQGEGGKGGKGQGNGSGKGTAKAPR